MRLRILGSNSQGNCYILENDMQALIIECGVGIKWIKQALKFNLSKVVGCLISHEHLDHCKAVNEVIGAGISVFATAGTFKGMAVDTGHHRSNVIQYEKEFSIGAFRVIPFEVKHDAYQPAGFLINHPETGTVLFVTDTYYVEKTFRGLNNVIIEANYSQEILDRRMQNGATAEFLRNRIFKSHMNLETCKGLLKANDISAVNNIVLIHLSDGNSHAEQFKKQITECTGKRVYVAEAGMVIENFHKQPF